MSDQQPTIAGQPVPTETAETQDATPTPERLLTRDEARAKILGAKPKKHDLIMFGVPVEFREPPIEEVMDIQTVNAEDKKQGFGQMVVRYTYMKGSEEKLFTDEDIPVILQLPFGKDAQDVIAAINEMMGVQPTAASKSGTAE